MSDESKQPSRALPQLQGAQKMNELRKAFEKEPPRKDVAHKNLADRTPVDIALDSSKTARQKAIEQKVIEVLRTIYDPEIPVNIYELGLIYEIKVTDDNRVDVKMTLTAPGCPVAGTLPPEVERKIEILPEVKSARVELVWDPPWSKDRMSEAALLELGLL